MGGSITKKKEKWTCIKSICKKMKKRIFKIDQK
jgi:hypothetical protein